MKKVNLITSAGEINKYYLEQMLEDGTPGKYDGFLHNGCTIDGLELVFATGRAACRISGAKIPKGELCIKGLWDFTGAGSHTCSWIHISIKNYRELIRKEAEDLKRRQEAYKKSQEQEEGFDDMLARLLPSK